MSRSVWLCLALCFAPGIALTAAAGDSLPTERKSLLIAVWGPHDSADYHAVQKMGIAYQAKHSDVVINIRHLPDLDAYTTLQRWCGKRKNEATDLVILPDQWLGEFAPSLLPVDKGLLSHFVAPVKEMLTRGGRVCGAPWIASVPALMYRADVFSAAKQRPPATWDELVTVARAVAKPGKMWGFGLPVDRTHAAQMLLVLLRDEGGEPFTTGEKLQLAGPEMIAALTRLGGLAQSGGCQPETLSWSQPELAEAFTAGRLAMIIANRQTERALSRRDKPPAYKMARLPKGKKGASLASISCLAGLNSTDKPGAVAGFLQFVASAEGQKILYETADSVPCHSEIMETTRDEPLVQPFVDGLKEASFLPPLGESYVRMAQVYDWLACEVIKGRSTAEEAVKAAEGELSAEPKVE